MRPCLKIPRKTLVSFTYSNKGSTHDRYGYCLVFVYSVLLRAYSAASSAVDPAPGRVKGISMKVSVSPSMLYGIG